MKKYLKQLIVIVFLVIILILPYFVFAEENESTGILGQLKNVGEGGEKAPFMPTNETTLATLAGTVVYTILSILGIVFISLTIYGGYLWMTDRGNEQQVEKAKKIISAAIIGVIIVASSWGIWMIVTSTFFSQGSMTIR